jgi:hypothetical protein
MGVMDSFTKEMRGQVFIKRNMAGGSDLVFYQMLFYFQIFSSEKSDIHGITKKDP